jgi:hypothetical protein
MDSTTAISEVQEVVTDAHNTLKAVLGLLAISESKIDTIDNPIVLNLAIARARESIKRGESCFKIIGKYHDKKTPGLPISLYYVFKDDKNEYIYYVKCYVDGKCICKRERM